MAPPGPVALPTAAGQPVLWRGANGIAGELPAYQDNDGLFRYFPGKAAIAWGEFDEQIDLMLEYLADVPEQTPLRDALADALIAFNTFPREQTEAHRLRMRLLLGVDELQAHSTLVYADWRRAVAGFVAARLGQAVDDLVPAATAHAALGIGLSAYRRVTSSS